MYHLALDGYRTKSLAKYADRRGYIPQKGDHWSDMDYDSLSDFDPESWAEFVADAVAATAAWEAALEEYREENGRAERDEDINPDYIDEWRRKTQIKSGIIGVDD